ncbi:MULTISPECIES: hypothetical protein [unclassified Lysobacter]
MTSCPPWSNASATCRLEWRPSHWLSGLLVMLGVFAALSVVVSDLTPVAAWPCAVLVVLWAGWVARREASRQAIDLQIRDGVVRVDGSVVTQFQLQWRAALVFARWRDSDNRQRRVVWWPDTLGPAGRRELRLAAPVETAAQPPRSMAP